jgi:hypothetical protein
MLISGFEKNQICNSSIYYYLFPWNCQIPFGDIC